MRCRWCPKRFGARNTIYAIYAVIRAKTASPRHRLWPAAGQRARLSERLRKHARASRATCSHHIVRLIVSSRLGPSGVMKLSRSRCAPRLSASAAQVCVGASPSQAADRASNAAPRADVRAAPTSAPRGGRPSPRHQHVAWSHGQPFARAHFNAPRGGRPTPRTRTSCSSHGQSFSPAPTSAPRGGRPSPPALARPLRPPGSRSRAPRCSTSRWPPRQPRTRTSTRPTGSRSRARPLGISEVAALRRERARLLAPTEHGRSRAPTSAPRGGRPASRASRTSSSVPRAVVRARPLPAPPGWPPRRAARRTFPMIPTQIRFSRAHFGVSRWPSSPRTSTSPRSAGTRSRSHFGTLNSLRRRRRACSSSHG